MPSDPSLQVCVQPGFMAAGKTLFQYFPFITRGYGLMAGKPVIRAPSHLRQKQRSLADGEDIVGITTDVNLD